MNALITGSTGLLGSHVAYTLAKQGVKVRAMKRESSDLTAVKEIFNFYSSDSGNDLFNSIEWVDGDILDVTSLEDAMQGIDHVYHCAAMVSFLPNDKEKLFSINATGTANVVNMALSNNVKKLCHVSSTATMGDPKKGEPIDESSKWNDQLQKSNYAKSKNLAEREVWRGIEEGLDAVIVNPSVIIGPGDWDKSSVSLFKKVWDGLKYYTLGVGGFVDVKDVVNCMIQLTNSNISGERFLLIGENMEFKKVFDLIAKELEVRPATILAKSWMAEIIWRLEAVKHTLFGTDPLVTKETTQSAFNKIFYSNKKIMEALDFQFTPIEQSIEGAGLFFRKKLY